ncbi:hypothetical protein [Oscillibacter sp. CU971]|uniref:hypothetical protein n=1 Tax=Oscillibacter sp. CU971 TaxID=2780102 RepID=UPI00195D7EF3|nr:hypothetical protein [Oscillibacter sp. CU971]
MAEDALTSLLAEYDGLGDDGEVWDRICWRGKDCVVPQLTDMFFDYGSNTGYTESAMRYFNYLAGKLSRIKPETLPIYKALLSAMDCRDLNTADSLLDTVRACLKSSNEDGNEGKRENLSRNKKVAFTIFPKSAEFVEPAK